MLILAESMMTATTAIAENMVIGTATRRNTPMTIEPATSPPFAGTEMDLSTHPAPSSAPGSSTPGSSSVSISISPTGAVAGSADFPLPLRHQLLLFGHPPPKKSLFQKGRDADVDPATIGMNRLK